VARDAGADAHIVFLQAVTAHDSRVELRVDTSEKDLFWAAEEGVSTG
jgi:hypothetical protein